MKAAQFLQHCQICTPSFIYAQADSATLHLSQKLCNVVHLKGWKPVSHSALFSVRRSSEVAIHPSYLPRSRCLPGVQTVVEHPCLSLSSMNTPPHFSPANPVDSCCPSNQILWVPFWFSKDQQESSNRKTYNVYKFLSHECDQRGGAESQKNPTKKPKKYWRAKNRVWPTVFSLTLYNNHKND